MSRGPSEEIKKQIIEHWNAGDTSGEIAKRFYITRNSVIGIVQRFKGPKRSNPATSYPRKRQLEQKPLQEPKPRTRAKPTPSMPAIAKAKAPPKVSLPVFVAQDPRDIVNVTGCRWPVMEDSSAVGGRLFCNADREDLKTYCPVHERKKVRLQ